ncbi:MAG: glycosyltransferase [Planctomycetota bacterium]
MQRVMLVCASPRLGGAERSLLELARAVGRERVALDAIVGGPGELTDSLREAGLDVDVVEMPRISRTTDPIKIAGYIATVTKLSRTIAGLVRSHKADLVHANGILSHIYAGEAARQAKVPCVWHARDMVKLGPLAAHEQRNAALVIAISEAVRAHLFREGTPEAKLRVVMNGIDLSFFEETPPSDTPARDAARAELGLDARAFVAGSAGAFVPWKRHEDFVRAFAALAEDEVAREAGGGAPVEVAKLVPSRAVLFGDDLFGENGRYAFDLKKLADELVGSRFLFTGWRADVPRMMPALDVFVSASDGEPFGRVVVEAMAAGVPVVATDSGGKREIVGDGVTGVLVPQGDVAALGEAMGALMRDPERRARMGEAARERARSEFAVDRVAREVMAVWDEALAAGPRA